MNAPARLSAIDRTIAEMPARAADTLEAVIETGAAMMVKQRWRIIRALRPWAPAMWQEPVDLEALLDEARQRIASQEQAGRAGHCHIFNVNRLIAFRQAERALMKLAADAQCAARMEETG